jgi:hypothetical protein
MSTQAHTPGPWIVEPKCARGNWLRDKSGAYVAMVCSRDGESEIEEDCNALLVAAAMGRIEDSGQTRKTHSGRDAVVWRITR